MKKFLVTGSSGLKAADLAASLCGGSIDQDCKVEEVTGSVILEMAVMTLRKELLTPIEGPVVLAEDEVKGLVASLIDARLESRRTALVIGELRKRLSDIKVELRGIRQKVSSVELLIPEVDDGQD